MKKSFKIWTFDGISKIEGHIYKGWGLDLRGMWVVTHLGSGRKIHIAFKYFATAKRFIDEIEDIADWHNSDKLVDIQSEKASLGASLSDIARDKYDAYFDGNCEMLLVLMKKEK